ncbi:unnamed protein product [Symbiodinium sp. CCMP2592]|nr:unnamed protein product [Symbiodinium sp. CCMP2592]
MGSVELVGAARVPVAKIRNSEGDDLCDVSINNVAALENSRFVAAMSSLDSRVPSLGRFIKHWASQRRINNRSEGTLSTYTLILQLFYSLQVRDPPVLPRVACMLSQDVMGEMKESEDSNSDVTKAAPKAVNDLLSAPEMDEVSGELRSLPFLADPKLIKQDGRFPTLHRNEESLGDLLLSFFQLWGKEDVELVASCFLVIPLGYELVPATRWGSHHRWEPGGQGKVFEARSEAPEPSKAGSFCFFSSDWADMQLPTTHRFPIDKYRMTRELLEEAGTPVLAGPLATFEEASLAHSEAYVRSIFLGEATDQMRRRVGFREAPMEAYVLRTLASLGATVAATRHCLSNGVWSGAVSGGTHHAFADSGEGFCVFNDIAVAARLAQREFQVTSVLVIDLDVHQGNGTAAIFHDDPSVYTVSVHQKKGYPFSTRCASDLEIDLPDGCDDEEFLQALMPLRDLVAQKGGSHSLLIYQAGVDGLQGDRFGRWALTRRGLQKRNAFLYSLACECQVPLLITMGGGYHKDIRETVRASADVYLQAAEAWEQCSQKISALPCDAELSELATAFPFCSERKRLFDQEYQGLMLSQFCNAEFRGGDDGNGQTVYVYDASQEVNDLGVLVMRCPLTGKNVNPFTTMVWRAIHAEFARAATLLEQGDTALLHLDTVFLKIIGFSSGFRGLPTLRVCISVPNLRDAVPCLSPENGLTWNRRLPVKGLGI